MTKRITRYHFDAFVECKSKAHLRWSEQTGVKTDFERLLATSTTAVANWATESINSCTKFCAVAHDVLLNPNLLKKGYEYLLNCQFENETLSLQLDGFKRVDGQSKLGSFHYVPILFDASRSTQKQKALLQLCCHIVGDLQGYKPLFGFVWRQIGIKPVRLEWRAGGDAIQKSLSGIQELNSSQAAPKLILNEHCSICEFQERCKQQARSEDSLSQLRGLGEKEIARFARKGILTLTQLAHTFRPRRKGKGKGTARRHYHELKAKAVTTKKVYVCGTPLLPTDVVQVHVDFEGLPDEGYVYLIGMLMFDGSHVTRKSFWAARKSDELEIFNSFLDELAVLGKVSLFTYGSYEKLNLIRVKERVADKTGIERALNSIVNVLSVIYPHVYFPTYSNCLKDIAGFLGFQWTDQSASGIQSIVWRKEWERTGDATIKQKLMAYNQDDCFALKTVSDYIKSISLPAPSSRSTGEPEFPDGIVRVQEVVDWPTDRNFGVINFTNPDFEFVNSCSYFDYQRERVFIRTCQTLKRNRPKTIKNARNHLRVTKTIPIVEMICPKCGGPVTDGIHTGDVGIPFPRRKRAFDLVFKVSGIQRVVYEFRTTVHRCCLCGHSFVPDRYLRLDAQFHGLKSWVIYQLIQNRMSLGMIHSTLFDFFQLRIEVTHIHMFKALMARIYRRTWRLLLQKILNGNLIHADETEVQLKGWKGYVWIFTNLEEVIYLYKPTREGGFLKDLLKGFKGVLVSDFYSAYDSLDCPQQKCLAHLIRDMNQDLLNHPFDEDLRFITQPFGALLRRIVSTIDQHGLKRAHLIRHKREVDAFFKNLTNSSIRSEAAVALKSRLLKNQQKLFTFLDYDGVPWNNNNAEHAIKSYAKYRRNTEGMMSEVGLADHLLLLSIAQTCRYKGLSFLRFLLSGCRSMDSFCELGRRLPQLPEIQVYPRGFMPSFHKNREKYRIARRLKKSTKSRNLDSDVDDAFQE